VVLLKGLSPNSLKELCEAGETAAHQFVLSRLNKKLIRSLDIQVITEKRGGITFKVEVFIDIEPVLKIDIDELADMATEAALSAIDEKMRGKKLG
jgi:hypothetical protein